MTRPVDPNPATRWVDAPKAPEPAVVPPVDTDGLRETATAANPGPWLRIGRRVLWWHGTMKVSLTGADGEIGRFDAEHIATFDPPTVLALLAELDAHRAMRAELVALVADLRNEATAAPKAATRVAMWKYHDRLACILGEQP